MLNCLLFPTLTIHSHEGEHVNCLITVRTIYMLILLFFFFLSIFVFVVLGDSGQGKNSTSELHALAY